MDLLSPENIAQLTGLLAEVSEDASHVLIAYFAIPVVLKIVGVMGWLLTIFAFYKGATYTLNKCFGEGRPRVDKVQSYSSRNELFLDSRSWDLLIEAARHYKEGQYVSSGGVKNLIEDAKRGKDLRLAEKASLTTC